MNFNYLIKSVALVIAAGGLFVMGGCGNKKSAEKADESSIENTDKPKDQGPRGGGIKLGAVPQGGPVIDKSGDATLQAMIKEVVPKFAQLEYTDDVTGKTMKYNLLTPENIESGKQYPLIMFIADASTPGEDATRPLTQGYGALVWGTAQWQAEHPCYVLVPQFSGIATDDDYQHTDEADAVIRLVKKLVSENQIDANRLYTTGQSMGGMLSMYYNVEYPDVFAASIFVDCHWATNTFDELVKHKFVYFIAGNSGKAYADLEPMEEACRKENVSYAFSEWSAKLPESEQSAQAQVILEKGNPVNIFMFEPGSVLPADGKGSEHMYSFDYAYRIPSVREWLFKQSR